MSGRTQEITIRFVGDDASLASTLSSSDAAASAFATSLEGAFSSAEESARMFGAGIDETAGKPAAIADAMSGTAESIAGDLQRIIDELSATQGAADLLGTSFSDGLGPGAAAAREAVVGEIGAIRDELAGLGADVAAAGESIGSITPPDLSGVTGDVDGLGESLGGAAEEAEGTSRSLTRMGGSATAELGKTLGLSDKTAGSLGKLSSEAMKGDMSLKSMAGAAGGMAVLGFAMDKLAERSAMIAQLDAFDAKEVDAYADALRRGLTPLNAIVSSLEKAGEVHVRFRDDIGMEISDKLAELGLSYQQFGQLVLMNRDDLDAWGDAMKDTGAKTNDVNIVMAAAMDQADKFADAQELRAKNEQLLGDKITMTRGEVMRAQRQFDEYRHAMEQSAAQAQANADAEAEQTSALAEQQAALDEQRAALERSQRAAQAARDTQNDLDAAATRLERTINRQTAEWDALIGPLDSEDAFINLANQFNQLEQATWDNTVAMNEGTKSVEQGMLDQAAAINATKRTVQDYVTEIGDVPASKVTEYFAMIDEGKWAEVEQRLATLARNRTMELSIVAKGGIGFTLPGASGHLAGGGPVTAGQFYEVLEGGSELFKTGGRTYLMAGSDGEVVPLSGGGGGHAGGSGSPSVVVKVDVHGSVVAERDLATKITDAIIVGVQRGEIIVPWSSG